MTDLGWANGWTEKPELVRQCEDAVQRGEKHEINRAAGPWSCTHVVTCNTCDYTYQYDSSG